MTFSDPPVTARDFARIACTCMDCSIGLACCAADVGEDAVKAALRALREESHDRDTVLAIERILGED